MLGIREVVVVYTCAYNNLQKAYDTVEYVLLNRLFEVEVNVEGLEKLV